jgi:small-conductance mechanosensitive channel/CRP-like cAMP-binding protein
MNQFLAAGFNLAELLKHAPKAAGPTAIVAATCLIVLIAVLPRARRREALAPFVFLAFAGVLLLLEEVVVEALAKFLPPLALLFLFASIGRTAFILIVDVLQRLFTTIFPKIYLDVAMALVYLPLGYAALLMADVKIDNILAGSAVISVVLGLAMQSTLGNFFAGLAIQLHQPFSIGDWIQFNDKREHIGKVRESNWRATTVVTLDEVEIVIPNNKLAELPLTNFYRPDRWSRRSIYFVCPYSVPPHDVQSIVLAAIQDSFGVLASPGPSIVTNAFTERGIEYWLRFFTVEMDRRDGVDGGVRDRVWYALNRNGISMPVATHQITVQQRSADTDKVDADREIERRRAVLNNVAIFRDLPGDVVAQLAVASRINRYIADETVIRQGDEGSELFVVLSGMTSVSARGAGNRDAHLQDLGPGEFFGEMSFLCGNRRAATVRAKEDCELLVIGKPALAVVLQSHPELAQVVTQVVESRQTELYRRLAAISDSPVPSKEPLLTLVQRYFGMI